MLVFFVKKGYRRSPHFVIFGTKRVSQNSGITNFETLFSTKSQIGSKNFLKSTFLANFWGIFFLKFQIFDFSVLSWDQGLVQLGTTRKLDKEL